MGSVYGIGRRHIIKKERTIIATTRLMPLHTGKGRSVAEALGRTTDYVKNPEKTNDGDLVSAYECNPSIVDQEFLFSKRQYAAATGRKEKENSVIAYHLRQSFKPGEITPEKANEIGYQLAMSLTKGNHAFIVCTHVDKAHIHSHIIFNSTSLDCTRKFRNFWGSSMAVRKLSDILCLENGLSVIENPQPSKGSYGTWLGDEKPATIRGRLEEMIDIAISGGCVDFEDFLETLRRANVEIKQGKHLAFRIPGAKRFIRCDSLGDDYSEEAILERIAGKRIVKVNTKPAKLTEKAQSTPQMLIDIQTRMQQASSPGYERWAKSFNLKEMAKTLLYLQEHDLTDLESLRQQCDEAAARFHSLADKSKDNYERMKEITELQKHIGDYMKTREIYAEYRKLPPKKQSKFYEQHNGQIDACRAAKQFFDSLGLEKLPRFEKLKQEYASLNAENKQIYPQYREAREKMMELLTAQNNVNRILGIGRKQDKEEQRRGDER